jgi:hypothetical protein
MFGFVSRVVGVEEGHILFAPTYRYKRGTRESYDSKKQKVCNGLEIGDTVV